jgi:hypothetical protein
MNKLLRTGTAELPIQLEFLQDSTSLDCGTANQVTAAYLARAHNLQIVDKEDGNFRPVNQLAHLALVGFDLLKSIVAVGPQTMGFVATTS